jgi:hexosaminidase
VGRLGIDFLHYPWQKMWAPRKVTFLLSEDGVHYTEQYHQEHFPVNGINRVRCAFPPRFARFVKVIALNKGVIPEGAYGAGGQALLLADEIFVDP